METHSEKLRCFSREFADCQKILQALGDENRQHLILGMLQIPAWEARVGEITSHVNLSRPAVSHHLKILREAGIISMREAGTKNYYSFDPDMEALKRLSHTLDLAMELMGISTDRREW